MSRPRTTPLVASTLVLVAALAVVVVLLVSRLGTTSAPQAEPIPSPSASQPASLTASEIYDAILPSLVILRVDRPGSDNADTHGLGTGVVANADGLVLTAAHVVADAPTIDVEFIDGTRTTATVVTADPATDIATLQPAELPEVIVPAVLGGGISVGSRVVAVGNPLGLIATTTEGVVSGLDRSITGEDGVRLEGMIQFDAAVNPGSSGGPLLNDRAEVVGVVSSLADPSDIGYFIGIGFAVPIGTALGVAGDGEGPEK